MASWPPAYGHSNEIADKNRKSIVLFRLIDVLPTGFKHDVYVASILVPILIYLWRAAQSLENWSNLLGCQFSHPLLIKVSQ
jgi:hypothetical protein